MIEKSKAIKNGVKILDNSKKNEFFENLKSNFPQTIKDGKADLKAISLLLGLDKKADISGYELTWTGKGLSNAMYSFPCNKELRLDEIYSNSNNPKNTIIIGDNLDALKILKSAYSEKIKMIYIDPPYNTANDNFIYPDNFREDYKAILKEVGLIEIDENGEETESETLRFFKNIQSSRTHSGWLSFMLPRLKLARDLLKEDGVIFISIDDNEQANLKILCDEIFGEDNFCGDFIRKTKSTTNDAKIGLNYQHEFLLCYAKDKNYTNLLGGEKDNSRYQNPDNDPNGDWANDNPSAKSGNMRTGWFPVKNPYTGKEDYPPKGMFWRFSQNTLQKHIDEGRICFKKEHKENERGFIYKRYLKDLKTNQKTFDSLIFTDNAFMNQIATKELLSLGMGEYFTYPKGVEFIKKIILHSTSANKSTQGVSQRDAERIPCYQGSGDAKNNNNVASAHCVNNSGKSTQGVKTPCYQGYEYAKNDNNVAHAVCRRQAHCVQLQSKALKVAEPTINENNEIINNTEPDIILDFFAGSGTTAQAVMELNVEDGGNREFILVQIDEEIKEEKSKTAYDFCKNELKSEKPAISDITIERVKRAGEKIKENANIGFKVFTLEDKPEIITNEEKSLELIENRNLNKMDIIINMALTNGKTLDKKIETVFDGKLYKCEDSFYLIECDKEILKYLTKTQNEYILIDAYGDMELEDFLNLGAGFKERLRVVY